MLRIAITAPAGRILSLRGNRDARIVDLRRKAISLIRGQMTRSTIRVTGRIFRLVYLLGAIACGMVPSRGLHAQTDGTCIPLAEREGREFGCFITARQELGALPKDTALYWHLDTFPTRPAADRARVARSSIVESLGRTWLFTIAPSGWRPSSPGSRVAMIGPLPLVAADSLAAVYMEGVFKPGMNTVVHRHAGVEAWFTLEGSMCLETPAGTTMQSAHDSGVLVRAGVPMMLTGTGTVARRSVVLILQDATQPRSTPAPDWTPRGLCTKAK